MSKRALTIAYLAVIFSVLSVSVTYAARTQVSWLFDSTGYIFPAQNPVNVLIQGVNNYLNFGTFTGTSGYGFRDNSGTIQWKNSGGAWANIGSGGGSLSGGFAGLLTAWVDATTVTATGSPTVGYLTATSTVATSTFAGPVNISKGVSITGTQGQNFVFGGASSPLFIRPDIDFLDNSFNIFCFGKDDSVIASGLPACLKWDGTNLRTKLVSSDDAQNIEFGAGTITGFTTGQFGTTTVASLVKTTPSLLVGQRAGVDRTALHIEAPDRAYTGQPAVRVRGVPSGGGAYAQTEIVAGNPGILTNAYMIINGPDRPINDNPMQSTMVPYEPFEEGSFMFGISSDVYPGPLAVWQTPSGPFLKAYRNSVINPKETLELSSDGDITASGTLRIANVIAASTTAGSTFQSSSGCALTGNGTAGQGGIGCNDLLGTVQIISNRVSDDGSAIDVVLGGFGDNGSGLRMGNWFTAGTTTFGGPVNIIPTVSSGGYQLKVGTSGPNFTVDAGGRVGVGTSSPWAQLSVANASTTIRNPLLVVASTTNTGATSTLFVIDQTGSVGIGSSTPSSRWKLSAFGDTYISGQVRASIFNGTGTKPSTIQYASSTAINVTTSSTFCTSGGNCGVGTTTPSTTFSVNGNTFLSSADTVGPALKVFQQAVSGINSGATGIEFNTGVVDCGASNSFGSSNPTVAPQRCVVIKSGVLKGDNPTANFVNPVTFEVQGAYAITNANASTSVGTTAFRVGTSSVVIGSGTVPASWGAEINAQLGAIANYALVALGGNSGIGTSTPQWLLQESGTRPSFALSDTSAGANQKHWLFSSVGGNLYIGTSSDSFATSTTPALTLTNGSVGIGTTSPTQTFSVNGQSYFSGTSTITNLIVIGTQATSTLTIGVSNSKPGCTNWIYQNGATFSTTSVYMNSSGVQVSEVGVSCR